MKGKKGDSDADGGPKKKKAKTAPKKGAKGKAKAPKKTAAAKKKRGEAESDDEAEDGAEQTFELVEYVKTSTNDHIADGRTSKRA